MNLNELVGSFLGLLFTLAFFGLIVIFAFAGRSRPGRHLRDIPAFTRLRRMAGLAVEAGTRLHISVGRGGLLGTGAAAGLAGLTVLDRLARAASISDRPPVSSSGEGALAILSRDTLRTAYRSVNAESQYNPGAGRLTGLTAFSFAAGIMPAISDDQISTNVLVGHFGSEVALIAEAAERNGSLLVAGSDELSAQALLFVTAQEPLIGEEVYAGGAYLGAHALHAASLRAQDVLRWLLIFAMIGGAVLKLFGVL